MQARVTGSPKSELRTVCEKEPPAQPLLPRWCDDEMWDICREGQCHYMYVRVRHTRTSAQKPQGKEIWDNHESVALLYSSKRMRQHTVRVRLCVNIHTKLHLVLLLVWKTLHSKDLGIP